jgi:enamine deaminase RidA (YjgF/YER057c/UK114 family)
VDNRPNSHHSSWAISEPDFWTWSMKLALPVKSGIAAATQTRRLAPTAFATAGSSNPASNPVARRGRLGGMVSRVTRINPDQLHTPPGYHHITVVESGRMAFLAGQCPLDVSGALVGASDIEAQIDQVVANSAIAASPPRSVGIPVRSSDPRSPPRAPSWASHSSDSAASLSKSTSPQRSEPPLPSAWRGLAHPSPSRPRLVRHGRSTRRDIDRGCSAKDRRVSAGRRSRAGPAAGRAQQA